MEPTTDDLDDILNRLVATVPEVKAAAIVSSEGLPIASALPQGIDETRIAAMTAALHSLAKHAIIALKKGEYDQLTIKGSSGYLLVIPVGSYAIMVCSATKGFNKSGLNIISRLGPFKPSGSSGATATAEKDL